jgi:hypothetical protein
VGGGWDTLRHYLGECNIDPETIEQMVSSVADNAKAKSHGISGGKRKKETRMILEKSHLTKETVLKTDRTQPVGIAGTPVAKQKPASAAGRFPTVDYPSVPSPNSLTRKGATVGEDTDVASKAAEAEMEYGARFRTEFCTRGCHSYRCHQILPKYCHHKSCRNTEGKS